MLKRFLLVSTLLGSFMTVIALVISNDAAISSNVMLTASTPNPSRYYNYGIYVLLSQVPNPNGICNYPDDLDSRGRRCGGRARSNPNSTPNLRIQARFFNPNRKVNVAKGSLDAPYRVMEGRVISITSKNILTVSYSYSEKCPPRYGTRTLRNEYLSGFNLNNGAWVERVRGISNCLGNPTKEWNPSVQGRFRIDTNKLIIQGDALDGDGSLLLRNALIIEQ